MNLYDVAYAPTLDYNLISMSKATRAGHNYSGVDRELHSGALVGPQKLSSVLPEEKDSQSFRPAVVLVK